MKKTRSKFVCQTCGSESPRWMGKCPECGAWNAMVEERLDASVKTGKKIRGDGIDPMPLSKIPLISEERSGTGIGEFDRVLGGGLVAGAVYLVAGAPGMGKSTLLLQVADGLSRQGKSVLYITGEESLNQVKLRANRLNLAPDRCYLIAETQLDVIRDCIESQNPKVVIVDSIQTVQNPDLQSLPGNVSQVRDCGHNLTVLAKKLHVPMFIVGHLTKEGSIAGPRVLEHLVDGLLLLESTENHLFRLLRAVKNRFGSTNEVGLFEMTDRGMVEIENPSAAFIEHRKSEASGTVVTVSMEGSRPLLVEIQALVTPTGYGIPQRTATGVEQRRAAILLAVLEKKLGMRFGTQDVFLNAAGGMRLTETAVDLAVVAALSSSLKDKPVDPKTIVLGEVGLTGEIRGVSRPAQRIQEAQRLGFERFILPNGNLKGLEKSSRVEWMGVETVSDAIHRLFT